MERAVVKPGDAMIEGVQLIPLRQIRDERGAVYHMLKATDPHFRQFGEIYFSSVYPAVVKGWKRHHRVTANYACVFGRAKVVLYDDRRASPTSGVLMEVVLGPDNYSLLVIPPSVWHGFQGMSEPLAIIANCATEPNDPAELDRLDPMDDRIPYRWSPRAATLHSAGRALGTGK
jgi:dTDP-4-dehydrorhamnose 3,5-epimerase